MLWPAVSGSAALNQKRCQAAASAGPSPDLRSPQGSQDGLRNPRRAPEAPKPAESDRRDRTQSCRPLGAWTWVGSGYLPERSRAGPLASAVPSVPSPSLPAAGGRVAYPRKPQAEACLQAGGWLPTRAAPAWSADSRRRQGRQDALLSRTPVVADPGRGRRDAIAPPCEADAPEGADGGKPNAGQAGAEPRPRLVRPRAVRCHARPHPWAISRSGVGASVQGPAHRIPPQAASAAWEPCLEADFGAQAELQAAVGQNSPFPAASAAQIGSSSPKESSEDCVAERESA